MSKRIMEAPLTDEERAFASDMDNYNQLFRYMKIHRLDEEEWYDILIMHYLRAVRKYLTIPKLQEYEFEAVLFRTLDNGRSNHYRAMNTQKRKPEGGFVFLDYTMESDHMFSENTIPEWWVDKKTSVERQVIFKESFSEFYRAVATDVFDCVAEHDKWLLDLILEGYEIKEIAKKYEAEYGKRDLSTVDFIEYILNGRIRKCFKKAFGI